MWFCEWNNVIDFLATHPDKPPVYIYHFTFDGEYNFSKKWFAPVIPEIPKGSLSSTNISEFRINEY